MDMTNIDIQQLFNTASGFVVRYAFEILGALVILFIGWLFARWLGRFITRFSEARKIDPMLSRFFGGAAKITVLVFVSIVAMGKFGISIGPMVAALGALTLGASFAVQGLVANYGAGLAIILTRPFTLGHTITVLGVRGVVEDITLGATRLTNEDGETILIPNRHIVGEVLVNSREYSLAETTIGIGYAEEPKKAVDAISAALEALDDVASDPAFQVGISGFGDSAILIGVRCWVPTKRYFQAVHAVNRAVHQAVSGAGVHIPYPQRDVHMISGNE